MTPHDNPPEGGSYLRKPDGSLERVAFTAPPEPAPPPVSVGASPAAAPQAKKKDTHHG